MTVIQGSMIIQNQPQTLSLEVFGSNLLGRPNHSTTVEHLITLRWNAAMGPWLYNGTTAGGSSSSTSRHGRERGPEHPRQLQDANILLMGLRFRMIPTCVSYAYTALILFAGATPWSLWSPLLRCHMAQPNGLPNGGAWHQLGGAGMGGSLVGWWWRMGLKENSGCLESEVSF